MLFQLPDGTSHTRSHTRAPQREYFGVSENLGAIKTSLAHHMSERGNIKRVTRTSKDFHRLNSEDSVISSHQMMSKMTHVAG